MKKRITILWFILLASLSTQANRLLVKSDGAGFAFTSIGEAIDSAQAGDTVVIFPRKDGQTWAITKTLTKPMVFLNGDSSKNNLGIEGAISIDSFANSGTFYFSNLALTIFNYSSNKVILNKVNGAIYGKKIECFNSQLSFPSGIDSSSFFYSTLNIPVLVTWSYYRIGINNSKIIGCVIKGSYNSNSGLILFSSSFLISNYFDFTNNFSLNDPLYLEFSNVHLANNVFSKNLGNRFQITTISNLNESVFANNYFDSNISLLSIQSTLSEGNYFKSATDPNVRNTLLANGFKQASNIQLDSIGRIIGNALVDSGSTIPWLRDVDGSPADVGITGGPFPIQNYIDPNPGNAEIIHVNIPRRVGYPNRPIQIKATGTSK
jgi:hypothetical protein